MRYPPAAVVHTGPSLQIWATPQSSRSMHVRTCMGCGAHSFNVGSDTTRSSVTPSQSISTSPIEMFLKYTFVVFHYSTRYLSLHRIWFSVYRLNLDARNLDLENATTFRRQCWAKTVHRMTKVWKLIIMVSSLIITLSVAFLQIDDILENIYPRTFTILAFVLASASLVASCILAVSASNLDSVGKFRQCEIASRNPSTPSSVDIWACLALPLTSLTWSAGFCSIALFSLVWIKQGAHHIQSKIDIAASSIFTSIAVLCLVFQFYRLHRFLTKNH